MRWSPPLEGKLTITVRCAPNPWARPVPPTFTIVRGREGLGIGGIIAKPHHRTQGKLRKLLQAHETSVAQARAGSGHRSRSGSVFVTRRRARASQPAGWRPDTAADGAGARPPCVRGRSYFFFFSAWGRRRAAAGGACAAFFAFASSSGPLLLGGGGRLGSSDLGALEAFCAGRPASAWSTPRA